MAWVEDSYVDAHEPPSHIQIIQQPMPQPTTILQQLPPAMAPPPPAVRPGHIREDLVELMMIQNAQMHQVIMNNMTMSALSSFGYSNTPETASYPPPPLEDDPGVYHHHYPPATYQAYPGWAPFPQPYLHPVTPVLNPCYGCQESGEQAPPPQPPPPVLRRAVPPPPPPSATGTVGAEVPPATEYYDATERRP